MAMVRTDFSFDISEQTPHDICNSILYVLSFLRLYFVSTLYGPPNVFYLRNWQVTFLLYTLGVFISEYIAKASTEPRDYRVVFFV